MESDQALLRALLCRDDVNRMRADAQTALAGSSSASWRATALVLEGVAVMLAGEADRADPVLADAVEVGTDASAWPATSTGLAERCLLAIQRSDWDQAEVLAGQALGIVQARRLDDYIMSALVHGVAARTALHRGDPAGARERLARPARLRPLLTHAIPWLAVQTLLELGRAYLALDDLAGARAVLRQAQDTLQLRPKLGILPAQVQELRSRLDTARRAAAGTAPLTAAELRLLPPAGHPPHLPRDRPAAVPLPQHGQDPGHLHLPQARRQLARPGGPTGAGDRPPHHLGSQDLPVVRCRPAPRTRC
jgi:LuxR family transcriptional regulator, maltose regulon positive regulatory protein